MDSRILVMMAIAIVWTLLVISVTWKAATIESKATQTEELDRLRELAATCYAGLGAECNLPENWLDALNAAANGESFSVESLLPFKADKASLINALEVGLEAAQEVAESFHGSYKGHRPDTHAALDADVETIKAELAAQRG